MTSGYAPKWAETDPVLAAVVRDFLDQPAQGWIWLARDDEADGGVAGGKFSALLSNEALDASSGPGWDTHYDSASYGFSTQYEDGRRVVKYERYPNDQGIEVLAFWRDFHGAKPGYWEVSEEFRLLFNLWEDRSSRSLYTVDDSGRPVEAVVVSAHGVKARKSLVRRYQAVKQLHLALYIDARHFSDSLPSDGYGDDYRDGATSVSYHRSEPSMGELPFSVVLGRVVIPPPSIERSGIWPFEQSKTYETFIIGHDREGDPLLSTSDPDLLANYFGANQGSPHYLTPVYFRREVLDRYFNDPLYSVRDGYLSCAQLWGIQIDNDGHELVAAFLGDLGRDLPAEEAQYWRSFNVEPPTDGPSETFIARSFLNIFADAKSEDLRFPAVYQGLNDAWTAKFGKSLFQPSHEDDRYVRQAFRIPASDSPQEFDQQILYLAKLLVDSLDEAGVAALLKEKPKKGAQGLAKLQQVLEEAGHPNAKSALTPIATIQGLRSRGAAHRKGSDYDIALAIGDLGRRDGFRKLLGDVIDALESLSVFVGGLPDTSA